MIRSAVDQEPPVSWSAPSTSACSLEKTPSVGALPVPCYAHQVWHTICARRSPIRVTSSTISISDQTGGDTYDRYLVRMEEMRQSLRIVQQALISYPMVRCAATIRKFVPRRARNWALVWKRSSITSSCGRMASTSLRAAFMWRSSRRAASWACIWKATAGPCPPGVLAHAIFRELAGLALAVEGASGCRPGGFDWHCRHRPGRRRPLNWEAAC